MESFQNYIEVPYSEEKEPDEEETAQYFQWLGGNLNEDKDLLFVAREAIRAPLPPNWCQFKNKDDDLFYYNSKTGESEWDHPLDIFYKDYFSNLKAKRQNLTEAITYRYGDFNDILQKQEITKDEVFKYFEDLELDITDSIHLNQITELINTSFLPEWKLIQNKKENYIFYFNINTAKITFKNPLFEYMKFEREKNVLDKFILEKQIGSGSFGKVYIVKNKEIGIKFAAKISKYELDKKNLIDISREISIISKFNHPCILKFICYSTKDFHKKPRPVIITEFASNGSLEAFLHNQSLNETQKLIIIYGIAAGMSYLHSKNIIHRDLKPENILLNDVLFPKIADFGLSKKYHINAKSMSFKSFNEIKGTPLYMAPEILDRSEYSKASDVYSFALIIYELITNNKPFNKLNFFDLYSKILRGYRPEIKGDISESYRNLIEHCWDQNPQNRPTFKDIVFQLKSDSNFINNQIQKVEFMKYIKYIDDYQKSFDSNKEIIPIDKFIEIQKNSYNYKLKISDHYGFFSYNSFMNLDDKSKILVNEAKNDTEKQFIIAQNLIECQNNFPLDIQTGIQYLELSIKNGNKNALFYYIMILIKGKIVPKNPKKALKLLKSDSINKSDFMLLYGILLKYEKKYDESIYYIKESIKFENNEAMYQYGKMLYKGKGLDFNKEEAILYFLKSINYQNHKAMYKYGKLLIEDEKNIQKGVKYIKMATEKNYPKALYYYSILLEKGIGMPINLEESCYYLEKAASKGHAKSMSKYGNILYQSNENAKSLIFLKRACDKGQIDSIFLLSQIYLNGKGDLSDTYKGIMYLKIAADNDNSDAMINYANILYEGEIVADDYKEAAKYYKMAAEKGDSNGMVHYGNMLHDGKGVEINYKEAAKYYKMAADAGNSNGMINYGVMLDNGEDIEINNEEAAKYYKMAADAGNSDGMIYYGNILYHGEGVEINYKEAAKYYKMAADAGNSNGMINYGVMLDNGEGVEINNEEAAKYYKMAADAGNSNGMIIYGYLLEQGEEDVKIKYEIAAKYYKMAADEGVSEGMNNYGNMLYYGKGVETNYEEAAKYYKMAADEGNSSGMNNYGDMLHYGKGVETNYEEAVKYYKMAAEKGDSNGMVHYGNMLHNGKGVEINYKEAAKYYKMAADAGNSYGMNNYGDMLHYGKGVETNYEEAAKYYKMAADAGDFTGKIQYAKILKEHLNQ